VLVAKTLHVAMLELLTGEESWRRSDYNRTKFSGAVELAEVQRPGRARHQTGGEKGESGAGRNPCGRQETWRKTAARSFFLA
jgi:hypothetical protein